MVDPSAETASYYCVHCAQEVVPHQTVGTPRCPHDGRRLVRLAQGVRPGDIVDGRYVLDRPLGAGGMGVVWAARQVSIDRDVAIKLIRRRSDGGNVVKRFFREAKASAAIEHPNVITIYDFGQTSSGHLYIAMELVRGETLSTIIQNTGPMNPGRATAIVAEVARALAAAHGRGIIHRDMKPGNIFLTRRSDGCERVKVVDFGLAKMIDPEHFDVEPTVTNTGEILGTPAYMSPEQVRAEPLGPASDIYSLGCVLYELLTGHRPFRADGAIQVMMAHLSQVPDPVETIVEVPPPLAEVCARMLAKNPAYRIGSAVELVERLDPFATRSVEQPVAVAPVQQAPTEPADSPLSIVEIDASDPRLRGERAAPDFRPPLVGRATHRRLMQDVWRACVDANTGMALLIDGPAGVGKSKLVEWFSHSVRRTDRNARVVVTQQADRAQGGLESMRQLLLSLTQNLTERDALEAFLRARLDPGEGRRDENREMIVHHQVRQVVDFLLTDPAARQAETRGVAGPDDQRNAFFVSIAQALAAASAPGPTVIVLDDLEEGRPLELGLVEAIARVLGASEAAILLIVCTRSESHDDQGSPFGPEQTQTLSGTLGARLHRLRLGTLDSDELEDLVHRALPGASETVHARIVELTGGNPLFALQLIRHLVASGAIVAEGDRWLLGDEASMPGSLTDLLEAREAALRQSGAHGEAAYRLLVRAAMLGRRFPVGLLEELLGREGAHDILDELDDHLDRLVASGWLRDVEEWSHDEDLVRFEHGFVQDELVRRTGSRRTVRKLRRLAAEALIDYYADDIETHAHAIALHMLAAGQAERGFDYLVMAGRTARARHEHVEALELLEQANGLGEGKGGASPDALDDVRAEACDLYLLTGQYARARELAQRLRPGPRRSSLLGDIAEFQRDYARAIPHYLDAIEGLEEQGRWARLTWVLVSLGRAQRMSHQLEEGLRTHDRAIELAEREQQRAMLVFALSERATTHRLSCDMASTWADLERAEELLRTLSAPLMLASVYWRKAGAFFATSRFDEALENYVRCVRTTEQIGVSRLQAAALRMAGAVETLRGAPQEGIAHLRRARKLYVAQADAVGVHHVDLSLADALVALGRPEQALTILEGLLAGDHPSNATSNLLLTIGEAALAAGRLDRAKEALDESLRVATEVGVVDNELAVIHETFGDVLAQLGENDRGHTHFTQALEIFEVMGDSVASTRIREKLAQ